MGGGAATGGMACGGGWFISPIESALQQQGKITSTRLLHTEGEKAN
jgi:uncharacterized protein YdgA (DUF945 family)